MRDEKKIEELTRAHREIINKACRELRPCKVCQGKPHVSYTPGCTYSVCMNQDKDCPCVQAAPDFDPGRLIKKIKDALSGN